MIVFGVLDDALAQIPLERTPLRYSGKMRAVTPDLASLFGPLVIRRQRQRWKSKRSHSPDDWPRFEVTRYVRSIDYDAGTSREEFTRRQGNNPPRGGGGVALTGRSGLTPCLTSG